MGRFMHRLPSRRIHRNLIPVARLESESCHRGIGIDPDDIRATRVTSPCVTKTTEDAPLPGRAADNNAEMSSVAGCQTQEGN